MTVTISFKLPAWMEFFAPSPIPGVGEIYQIGSRLVRVDRIREGKVLVRSRTRTLERPLDWFESVAIPRPNAIIDYQGEE
jgi:hypothetical protein